ncbi:MAG: hypothetical protein K0R58_1210 [Ramlibacter sp.]|jgi:hypothetical protein|nr:hypothetical protein [Ramlibacter sp.]
MRAIHVSCLLAGLLAANGVQAQSTLGELLDQGARKLSAAEVQALGDIRIVRQAPDADAYMALRADGTVVGMVHNKQGEGSSEAVGTWRIDASGRRCADVSLPAFRMTMQQCGYTFQLGRDIFFAPSDADRAVAAHLYTGPAFLR